MRPKVSLFDQAADKLRQAMEGPASGADRMRLIHEALALYHRHQMEEVETPAAELEEPALVPASDAFEGA
jgi:hypothetical protein